MRSRVVIDDREVNSAFPIRDGLHELRNDSDAVAGCIEVHAQAGEVVEKSG
jgi:hypothetical protein